MPYCQLNRQHHHLYRHPAPITSVPTIPLSNRVSSSVQPYQSSIPPPLPSLPALNSIQFVSNSSPDICTSQYDTNPTPPGTIQTIISGGPSTYLCNVSPNSPTLPSEYLLHSNSYPFFTPTSAGTTPPYKFQILQNPYQLVVQPPTSIIPQLENSSGSNSKRIIELAKTITTSFEIIFFDDQSLIDQNYNFFQLELSYPKKPTEQSDYSPTSPSPTSSPSSLSTLKSSFRANVLFLPKPDSSSPNELIKLLHYITQGPDCRSKLHPIEVFNILLGEIFHTKIFRTTNNGSTFTQVCFLLLYSKLYTSLTNFFLCVLTYMSLVITQHTNMFFNYTIVGPL